MLNISQPIPGIYRLVANIRSAKAIRVIIYDSFGEKEDEMSTMLIVRVDIREVFKQMHHPINATQI